VPSNVARWGRGLFFGLAFLMGLPSARAELVLVSPFTQADPAAIPTCSVETIIGEELYDRWGCDLSRGESRLAPDVRVDGEYWTSEPNLFLTVRAYDTVIGRKLYSRNLYIPPEVEECRKAALLAADQIAHPPFYETKTPFLDAESGIEFVLVPGGTFRLAVGGRERWVTVGSFLMGKTEVTQAQWTKVMGDNPSTFRGDPSLPVENVTYFDVQSFLEKLNKKTGRSYRLPNETEWEYAARTRGREYHWSGTNNAARVGEYAWTSANAERRTRPVGAKHANGLGLYDMSGNVWEWCSDRYDMKAQGTGMVAPERVIRGGSWMLDAASATVTTREAAEPAAAFGDTGFRIVLTVKELPE
jgi:sulfatase modifying factor 1